MESNKLDKFFREKLEERAFDWDESYWTAAQEALDADGAQRPRRRFLVWWFLTGFLLVAGLSIWWFGADTQQQIATPSIGATATQTQPVTTDQPATTQKSVAATHAGNDQQAAAPIESELTLAPEVQQQAGPVSTTTSASPASISTVDPSAPEVAPQLETPFFSETETNTAFTPGVEWEGEIVPTPQEKSAEPAQGPAVNPSAEPLRTTPPVLNPLPVLSYQVIRASTQPVATTASLPKESLEAHTSRWHFGLSITAGAAWLRGADDQAILQKVANGGLLLQRKLATHWYLSSGLSYQANFASYDSLAAVPQYEMSFGLDRNQMVLRPTILHRVQVPVGLQYAFPKGHVLELGATVGFQFGAHGGLYEEDYLYPWQRSVEQDNELERQLAAYFNDGEPNAEKPAVRNSRLVEQGWLGRTDLMPLQAAAYLNYRYQLSPGIELGVEASYGFRPLFKAGSNTGIGLGFRLNYWIF